ncbi:hypothetical protein AAG906_031226 [Vitis piasezkii]
MLVPSTSGGLYLLVRLDMALGCMLAHFDDSGKEQAIYYMSKRIFGLGLGHQEVETLRDRVFHIIGLAIGSIEIFMAVVLCWCLQSIEVWYRYPIDITSGMHHRSGDCTRRWSQTVGDPRGFQLAYEPIQACQLMEELFGQVKQGFCTFIGLNFKWKHEHKQWRRGKQSEENSCSLLSKSRIQRFKPCMIWS